METLAFLEFIKRNAIIYTLLLNWSFDHIDLDQLNAAVWSNRAIDFIDFRLDSLTFDTIRIVIQDSMISMDFNSNNSVFFDNSEVFFGKDVQARFKSPFFIDGRLIEEAYKDFGFYEYDGFKGPIQVTVRHILPYGYTVSLSLFKPDVDRRTLDKTRYFFEGKEVSEDILLLFRTDELKLRMSYTSTSYAPIVDIILKDSSHPMSGYFKEKISIRYKGNLYDHGKIPKVTPLEICDWRFINKHGNSNDKVLELGICEETPNRSSISLSYDVEDSEPLFYMINESILTKEELKLAGIRLEQDYELVETLFGKEAIDKFRDPAYSQGISVYKLK